MANDITVAISGIAINDKRAICSTLPTGQTAKLLIRDNYPVDLTIENIQDKYTNKFDEISYYTLGTGTIVGG